MMAATSLYGLIGKDLSHSFSEKYFREKFAREDITDAIYRNFPIAAIEDLSRLLEKHTDLKGFNITIPYKERIIPYLSEINEDAALIGAVNCVVVERDDDVGSGMDVGGGRGTRAETGMGSGAGTGIGDETGMGGTAGEPKTGRAKTGGPKLTGYNTDAPAFRDSLLGFIGDERPTALVLGSGGASKAVCHVLKGLGIAYTIVSRTPKPDMLDYADITGTLIANNLLIINTTPLGARPLTNCSPDIPYKSLSPDHFLFDLVYNPDPTEFLLKGEAHGAKTLNGIEMLIGQAERSWDIWRDASRHTGEFLCSNEFRLMQ